MSKRTEFDHELMIANLRDFFKNNPEETTVIAEGSDSLLPVRKFDSCDELSSFMKELIKDKDEGDIVYLADRHTHSHKDDTICISEWYQTKAGHPYGGSFWEFDLNKIDMSFADDDFLSSMIEFVRGAGFPEQGEFTFFIQDWKFKAEDEIDFNKRFFCIKNTIQQSGKHDWFYKHKMKLFVCENENHLNHMKAKNNSIRNGFIADFYMRNGKYEYKTIFSNQDEMKYLRNAVNFSESMRQRTNEWEVLSK